MELRQRAIDTWTGALPAHLADAFISIFDGVSGFWKLLFHFLQIFHFSHKITAHFRNAKETHGPQAYKTRR